jgi:hypothetical protein
MYLRYVQHGLWLKAHVKYYFSLFFSFLMFLYSVNGTLFLRSDDRSVVECVWNGYKLITLYYLLFSVFVFLHFFVNLVSPLINNRSN